MNRTILGFLSATLTLAACSAPQAAAPVGSNTPASKTENGNFIAVRMDVTSGTADEFKAVGLVDAVLVLQWKVITPDGTTENNVRTDGIASTGKEGGNPWRLVSAVHTTSSRTR